MAWSHAGGWYAVAMNQEQRELEDRRGLRFAFEGEAEVFVEGAAGSIRARLTELSFRGCYLKTPTALKEQQRIRVKISRADETFEASAEVKYVRSGGVGVVFDEVEPRFRNVLQEWILAALDHQEELQ